MTAGIVPGYSCLPVSMSFVGACHTVLGHVNCFGHQDSYKCDASRNLKNTCALKPTLLLVLQPFRTSVLEDERPCGAELNPPCKAILDQTALS